MKKLEDLTPEEMAIFKQANENILRAKGKGYAPDSRELQNEITKIHASRGRI